MKKKLIIPIVGAVGLIALIIYFSAISAQRFQSDPNKISVVTTLFPMYDFAKNIGGDRVEVFMLLPAGVEAHSFEPKPSDITKIGYANVFVYTGEFMEPWAHGIIKSLEGKSVEVVDASLGVKLMEYGDGARLDELREEEEAEAGEHDDSHDHPHDHSQDHPHDHSHHTGVDPHIWLDFENAKIMVENIALALTRVDPAGTDLYLENAEKYIETLALLDESYKNVLSNCETKQIVYGGHYAFGYVAQRYGLDYTAMQGFSPDAEPSPKDLIEIIEQIKKNSIGYIFYEELSSPKIAETISNETGAKMLLLHGAHNLSKQDYENDVSYLYLMEQNLHNLSLGLNCTKIYDANNPS